MLKWLKLYGVGNVAVSVNTADENMMKLYASGFRLAEGSCETAQRLCEPEL